MPADLIAELSSHRDNNINHGEKLIFETKKILAQDILNSDKILRHLKDYSQSFELINEEDVGNEKIFPMTSIKEVSIKYRLKFLDSKSYKSEIPYEAILKINLFNETFLKELKHYYILSLPESFNEKYTVFPSLLFVKTNYGNYFLVHQWGGEIKTFRKIKYWPMRSFENLMLTVISFTAILTLSLPTFLITLDSKAQYWSGYRGGTFFHLLIFNLGFTAYLTLAFSRNFSKSVWNRERDFS